MNTTTHPIGPGTVNRTANLPNAVDRQVSRLAFESDLSVSGYLRALVNEAVAKGRIIISEDKRQVVMELACVALFALGIGCLAHTSIVGDNEPRRLSKTRGGYRAYRRVNRQRRDEFFVGEGFEYNERSAA